LPWLLRSSAEGNEEREHLEAVRKLAAGRSQKRLRYAGSQIVKRSHKPAAGMNDTKSPNVL
jgi:hypothetical protein